MMQLQFLPSLACGCADLPPTGLLATSRTALLVQSSLKRRGANPLIDFFDGLLPYFSELPYRLPNASDDGVGVSWTVNVNVKCIILRCELVPGIFYDLCCSSGSVSVQNTGHWHAGRAWCGRGSPRVHSPYVNFEILN